MPLETEKKEEKINEELTEFERLLKLSEVYLGFLYTFGVPIDIVNEEKIVDHLKKKKVDSIGTECLIKILKKKPQLEGVEWIDESDYSEEFKSADEFFKKAPKLFSHILRVRLGGFFFNCDRALENSIFHRPLRADLYFTLFEDAKEGTLLFNIKLEDCDSNDVAFLRQCFMEDRHKLCVSEIIPPSLLDSTPKVDVQKKFEQHKKFELNEYIDLILSAFKECSKEPIEESIQKQNDREVIKTNIIEVKSISNECLINLSNLEACLVKHFPKQIYSLLVGDEGWKFVPRDLALSRLKKRWGTRGFFVVFSHTQSVVMFNFTKTDHYKRYEDNCSEINKCFGQKTEGYFNEDYQISGLQHGPLTGAETASVIKCYIETLFNALDEKNFKYLSSNVTEHYKDNIPMKFFSFILNPLNRQNEIKNIFIMRNAVNKALMDLSNIIKIWEVNELFISISENLLIPEQVKRLETKSNSIETEIMLEYQRCNSQLLGAITVLGVIYGIIKFFATYLTIEV